LKKREFDDDELANQVAKLLSQTPN
jgi:Cdc6-like AAA superfamily ATPase